MDFDCTLVFTMIFKESLRRRDGWRFKPLRLEGLYDPDYETGHKKCVRNKRDCGCTDETIQLNKVCLRCRILYECSRVNKISSENRLSVA